MTPEDRIEIAKMIAIEVDGSIARLLNWLICIVGIIALIYFR